MIITKAQVGWLELALIGANIKDSLDVGRCKASVRCGSTTANATKDSFVTICLGEREGCSGRRERFRMETGKRAVSSQNFD